METGNGPWNRTRSVKPSQYLTWEGSLWDSPIPLDVMRLVLSNVQITKLLLILTLNKSLNEATNNLQFWISYVDKLSQVDYLKFMAVLTRSCTPDVYELFVGDRIKNKTKREVLLKIVLESSEIYRNSELRTYLYHRYNLYRFPIPTSIRLVELQFSDIVKIGNPQRTITFMKKMDLKLSPLLVPYLRYVPNFEFIKIIVNALYHIHDTQDVMYKIVDQLVHIAIKDGKIGLVLELIQYRAPKTIDPETWTRIIDDEVFNHFISEETMRQNFGQYNVSNNLQFRCYSALNLLVQIIVNQGVIIPYYVAADSVAPYISPTQISAINQKLQGKIKPLQTDTLKLMKNYYPPDDYIDMFL
jgi:hypothetical protein